MPSTILITGANRGIGLALAHVLTHRGDTVIGTVRDPKDAGALRALGAEVQTLDVTDDASIASLAERLKSGGTGVPPVRPIDVLINNAGVSSELKNLTTLTRAELRRVFDINSFAPALIAGALLPSLRAGARKLVVNITSQLGSISGNTGGSSYAYRASKSALNQLTRSMAAELGKDGLTFLAVHPGWVKTDMGGQNAPLTPEQSAAALADLISKATPKLNGRFLNYDGSELPW